MDVDGEHAASISTNVSTVVGQVYKLNFAYARNPDSRTLFGYVPTANVILVDGNTLATMTPNGPITGPI